MAASAETLPNHKNLYHIVKGPGKKSSWRKFGAGFVNSDGSINIVMDLFPGQHFQLRDPNPPEVEPTKGKTHKVNRNTKFKK